MAADVSTGESLDRMGHRIAVFATFIGGFLVSQEATLLGATDAVRNMLILVTAFPACLAYVAFLWAARGIDTWSPAVLVYFLCFPLYPVVMGEGYMAHNVSRATMFSWSTTFLVVAVMLALAQNSPGPRAAFYLTLTLGAMALSYGLSYLVIYHLADRE